MLDIHTCTECRANKDQVEEELVSPPGGRAVYQGWRDGSIASASAAIGGGVGTGTLEGFKSLWRRTDESRVGSLPTRAAYGAPRKRAKLDQSGDARAIPRGRPVAETRACVIGGLLWAVGGRLYLLEPGFAVPAGPLEIVRLESPDAPRWIQAEYEEEPLRPLARPRSELQCAEL